MCMFAKPVTDVANTSIFVADRGTHHVTVYSMEVSMIGENAMILPVPCVGGTSHGGGAVAFINLEEYPEFFSDMDKLFPASQKRSRGRGSRLLGKYIEVQEVGDYEASFVASAKEFDRLDPRFKIPENCWHSLPDYKDYGFVVFRLKPSAKGKTKYHPMAYSYKPLNENRLFFPTVHVHDGEVPWSTKYDHKLYFELNAKFATIPDDSWDLASKLPGVTMDLMKCNGVLFGNQPIARLHLDEVVRRNQDYFVVSGNKGHTSIVNAVSRDGYTFKVSDFALKRHFSKLTGHSWTVLKPEPLLDLIRANWDKRIPGTGEIDVNRKVLVPLPTYLQDEDHPAYEQQLFFSPYTLVSPGYDIVADVVKRQPNEDYYIQTKLAERQNYVPEEVNYAYAVCYSRAALKENGGEESKYDWEVVCLIASPVKDEPMDPLTMARNMLEKPGGTKSTYTAEQFAEAIYYHSQRVKCEG